MKRHLIKIVSLTVMVVMVLSLASCDAITNLFGGKEHEHTFGETWSTDATNHWYAATCEDGEECKTATKDVAAHTFVDGKCSVCEYVDPDYTPDNGDDEPAHTHTFSADWASDATNHWHAATCNAGADCAVATSALAAHNFADGACTVCEYADPDYVAPAENILNGGEASVNATAAGVEYKFTAKLPNTYVITWNNTNAKISVDGEAITSGYEFELASGEEIIFVMATVDETDAAYYVSVDVKEEEIPAENTLTIGTKTVNATYSGITYTFATKAEATYVITWTEANAVIMMENANGSEEIASGTEFTLPTHGVATFAMCTVEGDLTYDVTIAVKEDSGENENENILLIGSNTVTATTNGNEYTFAAMVAGKYVITFNETLAEIAYEVTPGNAEPDIVSGYEFTVEERQIVKFIVFVDSALDLETTDLAVEIASAQSEVASDFVVGTAKEIEATETGADYTFASKTGGTFVITWTEANAFVMMSINDGDAEMIESGAEFTLPERGVATFNIGTATGAGNITYSVTISNKLVDSSYLTIGAATPVRGDTHAPTIYKLTTKNTGTFIITWTETNAEVILELGGVAEAIESGKEVVLEARQEANFAIYAIEGTVSFEITVTVKEETDTPSNVLQGGEDVTVNATADGTHYTFTAMLADTYTITFDTSVAYISAEYGNVSDTGIDSGYEFTLTSGQTITFVMMPYDMELAETTYTVKIDVKQAETNVLRGGEDVTVNATADGTHYTFTAMLAGTYTITFDTSVAYISAEYGNVSDTGIDSGYEFTLTSGQTITFVMMPYDMELAETTYTVKIDAKM